MAHDVPFKATAHNVHFSENHSNGHTRWDGLTQASADKTSKLLMLNHEYYHTMWNEAGLHNHIVHHLCSIYALGASPSEIQSAYDLNKNYQLSQHDHSAEFVQNLSDAQFFKEHLGETQYYTNYLDFFQDAIAHQGVQNIVLEYLFKGDERADNLLGRLHSGFEHPILHLGFALEFKQPCLVAESLASACVHEEWPLDDLLEVEKYVSSQPNTPSKSMLSIIRTLQSDPRIAAAAKRGNHPNRVTHALLKHARSVLVPILAQWTVKPSKEDIDYRMAEMTNLCAYLSGAAQNPKKQVGIDFFMMHSINLSVFYPVFMGLEWLSVEQKARLLTWKGWMDLVIYAACACPDLYPERISLYEPKRPGSWENIVKRARSHPDDGHTAKLIRALINAEKVSAPYESHEDLPVKGKDFLQIAHMVMDCVERMLEPGYRLPERAKTLYMDSLGMEEEGAKIVCRWVRWCGIKEAWDDVPDLVEGTKARL